MYKVKGGIIMRLKFFPIVLLIFFFSSITLPKETYSNCNQLLTIEKIGINDFELYNLNKKIVNNEFKIYYVGERIVCYYERKIGQAIVEKDYINYQFDKENKELLSRKINWRNDLKEDKIPAIITKEEVNKLVLNDIGLGNEVKILWRKLYIISPNSDIHKLDYLTTDPCWVVHLEVNGKQDIYIYNAVNGKQIGKGIVPPETGFTFSGPWYSDPCEGSWDNWYLNAAYWFEQLGYPTTSSQWPRQKLLQSQVVDSNSILFYEIAHGNSDTFASGCTPDNSFEFTYAFNIRDWIANSSKKRFIFLGSCEGMCSTGTNTFSYEFRKGSNNDTVSIGYCGMSTSHCDSCWFYSIDWQNALFNYMKNELSTKYAFDRASADYPACIDPPACVRFEGDENFILPTKKYLLVKKDYPNLEIIWYPPNNSNILYKTSLFDEFQILYNQVYPSAKHNNALIDDNYYYYAFELITIK